MAFLPLFAPKKLLHKKKCVGPVCYLLVSLLSQPQTSMCRAPPPPPPSFPVCSGLQDGLVLGITNPTCLCF